MNDPATPPQDLGGFTLLGAEATAAGWDVEVVVPAGARWFDGHFPGHPILPAVAQIALVDRLVRRFAGPGRLAAIDRFRLPLPVAPGDRLTASVARPGEDGRVAFSLRRSGDVVSGGGGSWASSGGRPEATARSPTPNAAAGDPGESPETTRLLPHRGPALIARRVVDRDADGLVCEGTIPAASPLAEAGRAPAFAALELAAQAAGLHEILLAGETGAAAPQIGYLVRVRQAVFGADLEVAAPLVVRVDRQGGAPPLTLYRLVATEAGAEIARGTLATYAVPPGP